jgi:aminoglycoside 6-adenylyltransferase
MPVRGPQGAKDDMTDPMINRLIEWGQTRPDVRAVILTSTRAAPAANVDAFSDYDVILAVTDVMPLFGDKSWLSDFGPVLIVYHDPLRTYYGGECLREITQYETGLKIDFNLWPADVLSRVAASPELPDELDVGYTVLLDKDQLTARLKAPSYQAFIPKPPTNAE